MFYFILFLGNVTKKNKHCIELDPAVFSLIFTILKIGAIILIALFDLLHVPMRNLYIYIYMVHCIYMRTNISVGKELNGSDTNAIHESLIRRLIDGSLSKFRRETRTTLSGLRNCPW